MNESGGIIGQYTFGSVYWHEITLSAFDFGIGSPTSSSSLGTPVNSVLVHYSIKSSFGCINSAVARVDDMLIYDVSLIQPNYVLLIPFFLHQNVLTLLSSFSFSIGVIELG